MFKIQSNLISEKGKRCLTWVDRAGNYGFGTLEEAKSWKTERGALIAIAKISPLKACSLGLKIVDSLNAPIRLRRRS